MNIQILGPEYQAKEEFDNGKITAQKPHQPILYSNTSSFLRHVRME
jgi:hypothetical protein